MTKQPKKYAKEWIESGGKCILCYELGCSDNGNEIPLSKDEALDLLPNYNFSGDDHTLSFVDSTYYPFLKFTEVLKTNGKTANIDRIKEMAKDNSKITMRERMHAFLSRLDREYVHDCKAYNAQMKMSIWQTERFEKMLYYFYNRVRRYIPEDIQNEFQEKLDDFHKEKKAMKDARL